MTPADAPSNPNTPLPPGTPLHTLNPTQRFSDRASDYRRARPDYAPAAIELLLSDLDRSAITIADIGAGTGISTRQLAAHLTGPARVLAIEPNPAMRDAAEPHPLTTWLPGTAEHTGLPDRSVDLLVCAQAFHWFKLPDALIEFRRILKPAGRFALLFNDRDWSDPATIAYGQLMRAASLNHPAETRFDAHAPLYSTPHFTLTDARLFSHHQSLDFPGLLARARSSSYCPTDGPRWDTLAAGLRDLHHRLAGPDGRVRIAYITSAMIAVPTP